MIFFKLWSFEHTKIIIFWDDFVGPQCVCVCLKVQEMPQLGPFHVSLRLWSGKPREDWVESWNLKPTKLDAKGIKYPSL